MIPPTIHEPFACVVEEFYGESDQIDKGIAARGAAGPIVVLNYWPSSWGVGFGRTMAGISLSVIMAFFLPRFYPPPGSDTVGEPDKLAPYWERQPDIASCAFQTVRSMLKTFGQDVPVVTLRQQAGIETGGVRDSDIAAYERMFEANGIGADVHDNPFLSADEAGWGLIAELETGRGVLVRVDVTQLDSEWGDYRGGHTLWVIGMRLNSLGQITAVITNDSGTPDGKGIEYPYEEFIGAWGDRRYDYVSTQIALFSPLAAGGESVWVGDGLP
ncbi:MAG: hypothetical protein EHM39_11930 [Chloroflexi bacterium]|nr:MAG: hypothetical protein EHM39_11930 [Chloroflexota bacterium]